MNFFDAIWLVKGLGITVGMAGFVLFGMARGQMANLEERGDRTFNASIACGVAFLVLLTTNGVMEVQPVAQKIATIQHLNAEVLNGQLQTKLRVNESEVLVSLEQPDAFKVGDRVCLAKTFLEKCDVPPIKWMRATSPAPYT